MSRVANLPIELPKGVEFSMDEGQVSVKGAKGEMHFTLPASVDLEQEDNLIRMVAKPDYPKSIAFAGTSRAIISNMVHGVTQGFEKRLQLVGVGYRAQAKGDVLNLTLGFSHPVDYPVPEGIEIETPSQTEVVVKGADKQRVGQVAAEIRAYRPPEPYKGKGVRYSDEEVVRKEAKKK